MADGNNLPDKDTVEEKPRKKRRLRKFLKVAGISFGLLLVALFVVYYICLLVITSEMEEDIQKWRNDPDNILNVRINKTPIRYEVDPEIARDLEKFYIGEFEILLPVKGMKNARIQSLDELMIWPTFVVPQYGRFGLIIFKSLDPQEEGYVSDLEMLSTPSLFSTLFPEYSSRLQICAWSGYANAAFHMQLAYRITRFLCNMKIRITTEFQEEILSCAPDDIDNCHTPWATFDLATRLHLKNLLYSNSAFEAVRRVESDVNDGWRGMVGTHRKVCGDEDCAIYTLWIADEINTVFFTRKDMGGERESPAQTVSKGLEKTILASFKRHDEKEAGQIMYKKAEEMLGKPDIKLADKLLGRFYAACALSQEPQNREYAQTYLATFTLPSEQAIWAYKCISGLFPENEEISQKAEELRDWEDENRDYFEEEGDDPEVEYPIVNEDARRAKVDVDIWKTLTPEEQKQVLEAVGQGKTYEEWFESLPEERKKEID